jgi:TonB family protein
MGLDEKAIDAVKQWKFEPGTKDGKPVAVFATIEITFQLDGSALLEPSPEDPFEAAHIAGKAGQQSVVGLGRPTEWGVPKYPPDALTRNVQGRVILLLTVGKNGHVKKASAISGDPLLTQAASDAVRKWWKFAPPTRDGKRVEAQTSATIEFKLVGRTPEISGTYFAAPVPTPQASQR